MLIWFSMPYKTARKVSVFIATQAVSVCIVCIAELCQEYHQESGTIIHGGINRERERARERAGYLCNKIPCYISLQITVFIEVINSQVLRLILLHNSTTIQYSANQHSTQGMQLSEGMRSINNIQQWIFLIYQVE